MLFFFLFNLVICFFFQRKRVNFPDPPTTSEKLISNEEDKNENKPKIKGKLVKRCKKQLDMNTIKYDFVMMYDNETDSDNNLEVGTPEPLPLNGLPEDTEFLRNNSTVDLVGLENVMDNKKDSVKMSADAFIDAIHNLVRISFIIFLSACGNLN